MDGGDAQAVPPGGGSPGWRRQAGSATSPRIGFRTVEIAGGEVRVNGKRIMIRGINRHEHDPATYRVMTASFKPLVDDLPDPLRLGLRFDSDPSLGTVSWYGRGPQEPYADRKTGYAIGLYTSLLIISLVLQ